jgi:hypothetical protein
MKTRLSILALVSVLSLSAAGCFLWPWHHDKSPQQQYAEALMRGNSMEASHLWLTMSPEDRIKFARGEGFSGDKNSQDEVKRQVLNHYEDQMKGPSNAEEMEEQIPTPLGASLQQLPSQSSAPSSSDQ